MNRTAFVMMLVAAALACGPANPPDPTGGANPPPPVEHIAPTEFCEQFATARCGIDLRCAPGSMQADVAACIAAVTKDCQDEIVSVAALAALPAGRIKWNAEHAQSCLDSLDGPCAHREVFRNRKDQWHNLWTGKVAAGASCVPRPIGALDEECASGRCSPCGLCPAVIPPSSPVGEGELCEGIGCAEGLWCVRSPYPEPARCRAPSAVVRVHYVVRWRERLRSLE